MPGALSSAQLSSVGRSSVMSTRASAIDGALELRLRHLRAAGDVLAAGFVVELIARPATGPLVRAQSAPSPRGNIVDRRAARLPGLAGTGTFLVHGARRDLLGGVLVLAPLLETFLDVFVLTFALVTP